MRNRLVVSFLVLFASTGWAQNCENRSNVLLMVDRSISMQATIGG
jgi:hypothetical protein